MGEKSRRRQESSCQENINTGHIKPAVSETAPAASVACTSNVPTTNTRHGGNNDEGVPTAWSGGRAVEVDLTKEAKLSAAGGQGLTSSFFDFAPQFWSTTILYLRVFIKE